MKRLNPNRLIVPGLCLGLAACGGGGDGRAGNPPVPAASLLIGPANSEQATATAYVASTGSANLGELVLQSGIVAQGDQNIAVRAAKAGASTVLNAYAQVPVGPTTVPCAVSGSITVSGEIADPFTPTLTAGDFFVVDSDACDDGVGEIVDGLLEMTVATFSGDFTAAAYRLTMEMTLTDLQITTADDVVTGNGDASVTLDTTATPYVTARVTGDSMRTDTNSGSETLLDFDTMQTVDAGATPSTYTLDSAGTLDSTELGGVIDFSTPVTFTGYGSAYPSTGTLLVEGDGGTFARLTALDEVNVLIELDGDGDGSVDETIETTWAELIAS